MVTFQPPPQVIIADEHSGRWLHFSRPAAVVQADQISNVLPALHEIEARCLSEKLFAAGYLSYEAAPALDPAFRVRPPGDFPLLWFGLFEKAEPVDLPEETTTGFILGEWIPSIGRDRYDAAIANIKDQIENGYTYQVNYTLRLKSEFSGDPWTLFLQLARNQQASYAAYIDSGRFALCSASPELFFIAHNGIVRSKPMKGTAARGLTITDDRRQADWLHRSEKNRAENVMIVDMVRNDLGRIALPGSITVPALFAVERYPTVWQMTSTVEARSAAGLVKILQALFPCASITGAPKISTMKIIADLETEPRKVYTGCIGFITPENRMQFNVSIRTVIVDRASGTAEYGVGGGITWDSTSADEYEECRIKARFLTQPRPVFSLLETLLWEPGEGYFLLEAHLNRLTASAEYFGFRLEIDAVREKLRQTAVDLPNREHKVRLILEPNGSADCSAVPLDAAPLPIIARLKIASTPVSSENPFLYHKTTNRSLYTEARIGLPAGCEPILWNERGEVTESDTANIVVRLNGRLITPPQSSGLLAGVFRARLIENQLVEEAVVRLEDLGACEEFFLVNSVRRLRPAVLER